MKPSNRWRASSSDSNAEGKSQENLHRKLQSFILKYVLTGEYCNEIRAYLVINYEIIIDFIFISSILVSNI